MEQRDKIAVLLPLYHGDNAEFVKIAIDSIKSQTYRNFIILLGVDGPIGEELQKLLSEYERDKDYIKIFYFEKNRGLAAVLNDLIRYALQGNINYMARMDADDICFPDRFEHQYNFLVAHPEVDVVGGWISEIDAQGRSRNKTIEYPLTTETCRAFFARRNPLAHPAVMFRRSFFDKVPGLYDKEYKRNQDTILWYEGFKNQCIFANIPEVVLYFRMTDALFKTRRGGFDYAKKTLKDRFKINKTLGYGISADLFAVLMFVITISPVFVRKLIYRIR